MKRERFWIGQVLKYRLSIAAEGFDMSTDDFRVVVHGESGEKAIGKDEMYCDEDGDWFVSVDTKETGPGLLTAAVYAMVPDLSCADGIRREVEVFPLGEVMELFKV